MGVFADFYRAVTGGQKAEFPDGIHTSGDAIVDGVLETGSLKVGSSQVDLLSAIQPVGKLSWFYDYTAPSADFPWFHLGQADTIIDANNWPDLVTYLRNKKLTFFDDGSAIPITQFAIESYSLTANVATVVFTNTDPENAILRALDEDRVVNGGFSNWRLLQLNTTLGTIVPGEYAITNINTGSRSISFAYTALNIGSTPVSTNVEFYTHRVIGSSTTARHFRTTGRTLMTVGDENGYIVGGLRRRDYFQGHIHNMGTFYVFSGLGGGSPAGTTPAGAFSPNTGSPENDGTNGTPRTAKTTQSASLGAYLYMWAGTYNP